MKYLISMLTSFENLGVSGSRPIVLKTHTVYTVHNIIISFVKGKFIYKTF